MALLATSLVLAATDINPAGATGIFVDPVLGDDTRSGSQGSPLRSLQAAAAAAAATTNANGDATVYLQPGRHTLQAGPLILEAPDRGSVLWRSADASNPAVVDGGTQITGWKRSLAVPGAFVAPLPPPIPADVPLRQMWVGGRRAKRPRVWISLDWQGVLTSNLTAVTNATGWVGFDFTKQIALHGPKYDPSNWLNVGDVEFIFHSSFIEPRCTARSLKGKTVVMAQPCYGDYSQRRQGPDKCPQGPVDPVDPEHPCNKPMRPPWFIENVFTNLTAEAGQWYYHRANRTILYMPRHGETIDSVNRDAFTTVEETLLVVNQTKNVQWQGVTFEHATWNQPSLNRGYVDWQAGYSGGIYGTWPFYEDCRNRSSCRAFADANGCGNTTKPPAHCGSGLSGAAVSGDGGNRGIEPSGNVRVLESSNISFVECTFRHLGGLYAVSANFGSKNVRVQKCTFTDVSGGAVHIGSSGSRWNTGPFQRDGGPSSISDQITQPADIEPKLSSGDSKLWPETQLCDENDPGQHWSLSPGVKPGTGEPTFLWTTGSAGGGDSSSDCLKVMGGCQENGAAVGFGSGGNCSVTQPPTACDPEVPCGTGKCANIWSIHQNGTITLGDQCLQVDYSEQTANGSRVNLAACTDQAGTEQTFSITPASGGGFTIKSVPGGKCIGTANIGAASCGKHIFDSLPRKTEGDSYDDWDGLMEITDNLIFDVTVEFQSAVGIFAGYVYNSTIAHNTLRNLAYTAISVGWGWNQVTFAGGNQISNNSIDGVLAAFRDGGNIYTQSHMRGSRITGNFVQHDGNAYGMIYTDGGSHVEVSDNVMNGGNAPSLFLHGGGCFKMGQMYYNATSPPNLCCGVVPKWTPRGVCESKTGHDTLPCKDNSSCNQLCRGVWNPNMQPIPFAYELDPQLNNTWPVAAQAIIDNAGRRD